MTFFSSSLSAGGLFPYYFNRDVIKQTCTTRLPEATTENGNANTMSRIMSTDRYSRHSFRVRTMFDTRVFPRWLARNQISSSERKRG